jgi:2-polyprenyl-3-methyl-5-hydroxy-6-metoxy-1,4-benzoquinol methylase
MRYGFAVRDPAAAISLPLLEMDAERWRAEQRKLREAVRVRRRTPDGRAALAPPAIRPVELRPPDLLRAPIASERGASGQPIIAAKRLLRRLLTPFVLEPQSRFNESLAQALAAQREELVALSGLLEAMPESEAGLSHVEVDYLGFEERFRGSKQVIESRQGEYLDYFFECGEILDIGCGRGEFLGMLQERGTSAQGVDLDAEMVARCREQGLTADCADAIEFLERQPDGAFGGVFMSQVVEHLSTEYLVALLDAISRKTSREAVLIVETINPESMPVLMRWFWLDPTHVRLVHPETLQYFIEQAGFAVKTVQFRRPVSDEERFPTLELESVPTDELKSYNDGIARINEKLFGHLDYFVVGKSEA